MSSIFEDLLHPQGEYHKEGLLCMAGCHASQRSSSQSTDLNAFEQHTEVAGIRLQREGHTYRTTSGSVLLKECAQVMHTSVVPGKAGTGLEQIGDVVWELCRLSNLQKEKWRLTAQHCESPLGLAEGTALIWGCSAVNIGHLDGPAHCSVPAEHKMRGGGHQSDSRKPYLSAGAAFNTALEAQAIRRAHRMGQTRPVTVRKAIWCAPECSQSGTVALSLCSVQSPEQRNRCIADWISS